MAILREGFTETGHTGQICKSMVEATEAGEKAKQRCGIS